MLLVTERLQYWPMSLPIKNKILAHVLMFETRIFFVNVSHSIIISQNHSKTLTLVVWEMVNEILFEKHAVIESPSWLIT